MRAIRKSAVIMLGICIRAVSFCQRVLFFSTPLLAKNGLETYNCDTAPRDVSFPLLAYPIERVSGVVHSWC